FVPGTDPCKTKPYFGQKANYQSRSGWVLLALGLYHILYKLSGVLRTVGKKRARLCQAFALYYFRLLKVNNAVTMHKLIIIEKALTGWLQMGTHRTVTLRITVSFPTIRGLFEIITNSL
ncbi:hypothetical protein M5D96_004845, partial [Drosophila gunungcola]